MTIRWRALVVDDEPPARTLLAALVEANPHLVLAGRCADGDEAVAAIEAAPPDLVLLDIQMPGCSGFDVIDRVGVERMPLVVFVTAYNEHALRAFRAHAFDYLLKPVEAAEFERTVERAARRLAADADADAEGEKRLSELGGRLDRLLSVLQPERRDAERLTIWHDGRAAIVRAMEVDRADVDGNYVRLRVGPREHLMRTTLGALEERLSRDRFVRLNRSTLVNVDFIRELQTYLHGDIAVVLKDGSSVITGPTYRDRIRERFRM
jgi:two-component system LytT family response regulator